MLFKKYIFNHFCIFIFLYIALYFFLNLMPPFIQKNGLLNNQINLAYLVQSKALAVADSMEETNLGLNFIGNFHKQSPFEAKIFQSSGLVHLLAISGGQILPLVNLSCFLASSFIFFLLKNKYKPHEIMQKASVVRNYLSFLLSFFIAILFGGTGALVRVAWLNFFNKLNFFNIVNYNIFKLTKEFTEPFVEKIFIILLVSFLFGNIFLNYSFILSAIGASCAEISSYLSLNIILGSKRKNQKSNLLDKILYSRFFKEVIITIITCIMVGIILSPLSFNSIFNSCLANVFAIPVITFLVTPLALLVLIFPTGNLVADLLLLGLDLSLSLFKHIAIVFSDSEFIINNTILFSANGLLYLNVMMVFLWGIIDLIRSRKLFLMRYLILLL